MHSLTCPMPLASHDCPPLERSIGIVVAVALHAILIVSLLQQESTLQPEPLQPPVPLMVSLIAPSKPAPESPKPAVDTQPVPAKPKPVKLTPQKAAPIKPKVQSERTTSTVKRPLVIAASSDAPASYSSAPPESSVQPATATPPVEAAPAPITPPRFNANYLDNPAPDYPPQSRSEGEEGKVILRVFVNPHGGAEQVEVRRSSGFHRLDEAARATVKHWRFVPARQGGETVSAWVLVPIAFSIED